MSKKDGPKGLDVGTANLLVAVPADDGTKVKRQRNAFLEIEADKLKHAKAMMKGVGLVEFNKRAFIVGEDAFRLANLFRKELRRPMASGTVNPAKCSLICASTSDLSKSPTAMTAIRSGRYQSL